jgi:hypothetical protein
MQQPATAPPPADPAPLRRPHAPPSEDPTARDGHPSRPAPPPATWYQRTFHGRADQVGQVRREIAAHLHGCPAAADAVLIASELAGNAVTHSASAGEFFTVRCQAYPDYVSVTWNLVVTPSFAMGPDVTLAPGCSPQQLRLAPSCRHGRL